MTQGRNLVTLKYAGAGAFGEGLCYPEKEKGRCIYL
jgi:hypothetical protein